MIALLVQTMGIGNAHRIMPVSGDWGIDVLVGELNDRVTVWQAKYFIDGVRRGQLRSIQDSFESARRAAAANGYVIERWVLCIPTNMEKQTLQEWQRWRSDRQKQTGIEFDLWGETQLIELLMRPEAAHIVRAFYAPGGDRPAPTVATHLRIAHDDTDQSRWCGGHELQFDDHCYVLHDPVEEQWAADRSWVRREATAEQLEPDRRRVRLRQVEVVRPGLEAMRRGDAFLAQADLLATLAGRGGLPQRLSLHRGGVGMTLVTAQPAGPTWKKAYRPGERLPDRLGAAAALAAVLPVCAALAELHRHGHSHRAVEPDAIVLVGGSRSGALRDVGLAGMPALPGEGPAEYRAAEQHQLASPHRPGSPVDVYQVAAIVYHTLTGHHPIRLPAPPVAASLPQFPAAADDALARALDSDPIRRPTMAALAAALRTARSALSRGESR